MSKNKPKNLQDKEIVLEEKRREAEISLIKVGELMKELLDKIAGMETHAKKSDMLGEADDLINSLRESMEDKN